VRVRDAVAPANSTHPTHLIRWRGMLVRIDPSKFSRHGRSVKRRSRGRMSSAEGYVGVVQARLGAQVRRSAWTAVRAGFVQAWSPLMPLLRPRAGRARVLEFDRMSFRRVEGRVRRKGGGSATGD
jgi:hypothetical protein